MRRVSQHFAREQRRPLFVSAQNHRPLNTRISKALLDSVHASKHPGFVAAHPSTVAAGEDDGYNTHCHPSVHAVEFIKGCFEFCKQPTNTLQQRLSFPTGASFGKPLKETTNIFCVPFNRPFEDILQNGVIGWQQALDHGYQP